MRAPNDRDGLVFIKDQYKAVDAAVTAYYRNRPRPSRKVEDVNVKVSAA